MSCDTSMEDIHSGDVNVLFYFSHLVPATTNFLLTTAVYIMCKVLITIKQVIRITIDVVAGGGVAVLRQDIHISM